MQRERAETQRIQRLNLAFGLVKTAQDRFDSRQQFARIEGFADVVIGTELQTDDAIGLIGSGGEHNDGDARLGTNFLAQNEAIVTG